MVDPTVRSPVCLSKTSFCILLNNEQCVDDALYSYEQST